MSVDLLQQTFENTTLTGAPRLVLLVLAWHANPERAGLAWPGLATIAREAGVNRRTAQRALDALETGGFIEAVRPANPVESRPTVYAVTPSGPTPPGGAVSTTGGGGATPPGLAVSTTGPGGLTPPKRNTLTKTKKREQEIQIALDEIGAARAAKKRRQPDAEDEDDRFTRGRYGQYI